MKLGLFGVLALVCVGQCLVLQASPPDKNDTLNIELYMESMCPFCSRVCIITSHYLILEKRENLNNTVAHILLEHRLSLLPFQFTSGEVKRAVETAGIKDLFHLELIPYGNARETVTAEGAFTWVCQHGPAECNGNIMMVHISSYFIFCFNVCLPYYHHRDVLFMF